MSSREVLRDVFTLKPRPTLNPNPEGPYTLFMELGPKKTIPVWVLGT